MEKDTSGKLRPRLAPIGSLFSETWQLYKERFAPLVRIVLLPVLVTILGYTILDLRFSHAAALGGVVLLVGWLLSIFNILPLVLSLQNETDVDDSYKAALPLVLPFVWLIVLESLVVLGGFVILIVPGVWLIFAFSFTSYVFVIEGRRGIDVLRASKEYVRGYWWPVVVRLVLVGIFVMMASAIVQSLTASTVGVTGENIAAMILTLFTTPFTAIFGYKLYENLKALKPASAEKHPSHGAHSAMRGVTGAGFLTASAIVGVVALVAGLVVAVYFAWHGMAHPL